MARAMTRREVIDKYVRFEQTPWGTQAADPKSMQRALSKMLKLARKGLLLKDDGTPYRLDEITTESNPGSEEDS